MAVCHNSGPPPAVHEHEKKRWVQVNTPGRAMKPV
jgi:hypothetical protein